MLEKLLSLRSKTVKLLEKTKGLPLLVLRVTVGLVFIQTGWGKVHNIGQVTEFFTSLHIPAPHLNALVASWTELLGGAALIIGLGTRLFSVPLAVTMVVAIFTAVLPDPDPDKVDLLRREELHYLVAFFALIFLGPGPLSLDFFVARKLDAPAPAPAPPAPTVVPPPAG